MAAERVYESFIQQNRYNYRGYAPPGYQAFGKTPNIRTNSTTYNFSSNYRQRRSTEWTPSTVRQPDPPMLIQPYEIYFRHMGHLPAFTGYIPGARFRFGKTFGNDTKDAKRWLRGDFTS